ncbi:gamma-glutamyltranspeptidase [Thelonectria olida]|uniref:Glutathione hydrolase n=1 Tax=Thelonectria olida TaxID=1576542 RepID=A0A9P8WC64_9HYPO|nr:gamma-glutamyltranspeptidase [Thelonectria olida]
MKPLQYAPSVLQLLLASCLHPGLADAGPYPQGYKNDKTYKPDQNLIHTPVGSRGAVASEANECSHWGKQILTEGGNAVDAAVATTFCVGVLAPYHSGIGGGGFMLVRDKHGMYEAIDFRESAPAAAHENMYEGNIEGSIYGGLSVAVPGEVRGLWYAHQKYGQLPWKRLLEGAHYRAKAVRMNADYMSYINKAVNGSRKNFIVEDPSWAADYVENGKMKGEGSWVRRDRYAKTLKRIAEKGPDGFYKGRVARALVQSIRDRNGTITMDDFKNYQVKTRPVLTTTYRGYKLHTVGAPASGAVALNIINVMEGYPKPDRTAQSYSEYKGKPVSDFFPGRKIMEAINRDKHSARVPHIYDVNKPRDSLWHKFVEAMRFGYAARGKLGDPDYVDDVRGYENAMIDKENAKRIRKLIDPKHTQNITAYDPGKVYQPSDHGTSHIATADDEGMAVSLTSTVNLLFGSRIMDAETGVILNNEMNDFSIPGVSNEFHFEPSESNFIRPGKRPLSSITPIIVERPDGAFFVAVGAAGGSRIISATSQVLWRVMSEPVGINEAVNEPRLHDQLMPNKLLAEKDFPITTVRQLRDVYGHNVTWVSPGLSIVEGVIRDKKGYFEAGSDARQKNHGGVVV